MQWQKANHALDFVKVSLLEAPGGCRTHQESLRSERAVERCKDTLEPTREQVTALPRLSNVLPQLTKSQANRLPGRGRAAMQASKEMESDE